MDLCALDRAKNSHQWYICYEGEMGAGCIIRGEGSRRVSFTNGANTEMRIERHACDDLEHIFEANLLNFFWNVFVTHGSDMSANNLLLFKTQNLY